MEKTKMEDLTNEERYWFACRVFYNKIKLVKEELAAAGIQFYVPVRLIQHVKDDEVTYTEEPIIPSLIFIRSTEGTVRELKTRHAGCISVYLNPGTRRVAVIPDKEMEIFMYVTSKGCKQLETVDEKIVQGNRVRITGGLFEGAEGYITRVHGTKRFVVLIKGVAALATTFVPRCFIEKID